MANNPSLQTKKDEAIKGLIKEMGDINFDGYLCHNDKFLEIKNLINEIVSVTDEKTLKLLLKKFKEG